MTSAATQSISALDDARLRSLLASASALRPPGGGGIARVRRVPGAYHSSFAIEDVELTFDDAAYRAGKKVTLVALLLTLLAIAGGLAAERMHRA